MKKTLIALLCAAAIPAAAYAASGDRGRPDRGARMERLAERLELSDEQRARLETLFEEQRAERDAMREQMRARMAEVLTPEQQARMGEMREQRRDGRHHGRHHGRPGGCEHERGEYRAGGESS